MPDMKLAYLVTNVGNGNRFLSDSMEFVSLIQNETNDSGNTYQSSNPTLPLEIFMIGLGSFGRRPILFIRTRTDLMIYHVNFTSFDLIDSHNSPKHFTFMCRLIVILADT